MPFYTARSYVSKRCICYNKDTDEEIPRVESVDTDRGILVEFVGFVDERGRRMKIRQSRRGNFYVKDRITGEVNPSCSDQPPVIGTRKEFLRVNNRGNWQRTVSGYMSKEQGMEILKKESGLPIPQQILNPMKLEVEPYLNSCAGHLYKRSINSTTIEYLEGLNGEIIYYPYFEVGSTPKKYRSSHFDDTRDYGRKIAFVRYAAKQVTLYSEVIPDNVIERWAKVLNMLVDKGIWEFGILGTAMALPLAVWGDDTKWVEHPMMLVVPVLDKKDPRPQESLNPIIITAEEIKKRGRRVLLLAYLGVTPEFEKRRKDGNLGRAIMRYHKDGWDLTDGVLNEIIGNELFVEEGGAGNNDWTNLPE